MPTAVSPKLTPVPIGPWRGRKSSTTRDLVPEDYAFTGQNSLFVPNSELYGRKGVGHWRRRDGQTELFDTFASPVGLLPAKWGAKARWMQPFKSDSITDHQDTVIALITKEDFDDDTLLDDGRFSNVYIRDQVQGSNYTLGSEYSATTYPAPGTEQSYKYIPVWYESGDGGLTRGVTEFDRRFFVSGARRFLKAHRWWYFPDRYGTPLRTQFGSSQSSTGSVTPDSTEGGSWGLSGAATKHQAVATDDSDTSYIESGAGSDLDQMFTLPDIAGAGTLPNTGWTFTIVARSVGGGILNGPSCRIMTAADMTAVIFSGGPLGSLFTTSYQTFVMTLSAGEAAAIQAQMVAGTVHCGFRIGAGNGNVIRITKVSLDYPTSNTTGVTRLIPSGPIPSTWPGKLTTGTAVSGSAAAQRLFPTADVQDSTWLGNDGGSSLFTYIDDTSTSDYVHTTTESGNECIVALGDPAGTPVAGDTVSVVFAASDTALLAFLTMRLLEGSTQIAARNAFVHSAPTQFSLTLTDDQIESVVDWTNLRLAWKTNNGVIDHKVYYAYVDWTPGAAEGGWKGSKRFFFSIAPVFEDGSTWMPVIPRLPSADNALGVGFYTVNIDQPDVNFDKITWTLPKFVHGVTSWRLLRGLSIDATLDDNRLLNPYDMRVIATVPANTDTYDDFASDDTSLEDDPSRKVIHFDHSMPPRTKYIAGGEQRVAVMNGGFGPCAFELAPIGVTADYDLNFDDETDSIYGATYASYMRIEIDTAGAGQLVLTKSDGATLVASKTYTFVAFPTLQRLVDAINATTCAADSLQWRAQLCPGVTGTEDPTDVLTPHKRVIASCVVTNASNRLTKAAGGLSKVAIGTRIDKTGVTAGTYVLKIISDTELQMSAVATSTSTSDATFYTNTGDNPTAAETNKGWQRVIANSLVSFTFFNTTYLNTTYGIDKARVWLTAASPFQTRSAANNFTSLDTGTYLPPTDSGIGIGIASPERGFVLLWEHQRGYIANEVDGGTGDDRDYKVRIANSHQGACAWDSVDAGNGFVTFAAPDGIYAAQLIGGEYRELKLTDDTWRQWPDPLGDFTFEMPLCQAASVMDKDTGKLSVRVLRNWIWVQYRTSGTHPNRQTVMDFSAGADSFGLRSLMAEDGRVWPWSPPLLRSVTSLAEIVRSDGSHIYAWNEENAGSTGDGRIDEIETGDTDNGIAISGTVESGWIKPGHDEELSAQECTLCHLTPTGATTFFDTYRSRLNDGPYTLTLTVTGPADVTDELKFLTQAARVKTDALRWIWRQTTGPAGELRPGELRLLRLQRID